MRKNIMYGCLVIMVLILAMACSNGTEPSDPVIPVGDALETNVITQFGITWTFDKPYRYGQFANGEYWVVGPVTLIDIFPPSLEITGTTTNDSFTEGTGPNASTRIMNGSMLNPSPDFESTQGYDNEMYRWHTAYETPLYPANYDSALNVALNVSSIHPLDIPVHSSLVSTISYQPGSQPQLKTAAVLTILDAPAPEGSFRPPYSGVDKTIKFNTSQLNNSLLKSLSSVDHAPDVADISEKLSHVWIDHFNHRGDGTQYSSPEDNMPNYGREYSQMMGEVSLLLMLDNDYLENTLGMTKERLLKGIVQIGIDNYGVLINGGYWLNNGGLNCGRKWPILMAGIFLDDNDMKNIGSYVINKTILAHPLPLTSPFHEDQQTFYVDQSTVDATHVDFWGDESHTPYVGPDKRDAVFTPFESSDIGLPEWGLRAQTTPSNMNKEWQTVYRQCCNANSWAGFTLAAYMLDAKALWNNDALFDYMDRYMATETQGDWLRQRSKFLEDMWDAYRSDYAPCYSGLEENGTRLYGDCDLAGVVK